MVTIVQEFGPIYGEAVNGTVQGRPNGSVYVPLSNIVNISIPDGFHFLKYNSANVLITCDEDGTTGSAIYFDALSQDLASNVKVTAYSDASLETKVASRGFNAGQFNSYGATLYGASAGLTDGQTIYLRGQLMNNGTPVATSSVIEVEMVVP